MHIIRQGVRQAPVDFADCVYRMSRKPTPDADAVCAIVRGVAERGDKAIYEYEKKFGGINSTEIPLRLSDEDIAAAYDAITAPQRRAIKEAAARLSRTEKSTFGMLRTVKTVHGKKGSGQSEVVRRFVPLQSVGCYIPGGLARYPSSAIMSVIPAAIAGVPRIAAVTPALPDGTVDPLTVVSADSSGATEIYRVGGAHAIAALAYGTESIPRVAKIVGPGGAYVTAAKRAVSDAVGIDMLAGPTELGVLADSAASARLVSLDIISQAEHSADTQCYLITTSQNLASRVNDMLSRMTAQKKTMHRRDIIHSSIAKNGFIALARDMKSAIAVANALAPEHLEIMTKNPSRISNQITTPGMMLLGDQSPSAASDYLLGSNHVLPTNGSGRSRGSLSVLDFVKMMTTVQSTGGDLHNVDSHMRQITDAEGLANHYMAVRGRLKEV